MSVGRYRKRTHILQHLPFILLWLSPKGSSDCGGHDWYNEDGQVERCLHCKVGIRAYSPEHFDQ